ncbi:MAG: hypothetical protein NTW04_05035 [Elusimicrobia bacterium]|nr:hypothetical protein [Elusimicrobiota bacterium]
MTESEIRLGWKQIISETRKRTKLGVRLGERKISRLGDLLFISQVLLGRIMAGENNAINSLVFRKTMNFYTKQMKKYI